MSEQSYQTSSTGWSVRLLRQRTTEWFEGITQRSDRPAPDGPNVDWSLPDWAVNLLFWGLTAAVVLWIAWRLLLILERQMKRWRSQRMQRLGDRVRQRGTEWPVSVWLQRAQTLQQQGNYGAACRALYMALLQLLHDRDWVPHRDSRTNGEYLETLHQFRPQDAFRLLIGTHDRSQFSAAALSATDYQQCSDSFADIQNTQTQPTVDSAAGDRPLPNSANTIGPNPPSQDISSKGP